MGKDAHLRAGLMDHVRGKEAILITIFVALVGTISLDRQLRLSVRANLAIYSKNSRTNTVNYPSIEI